jgi:hypothetical protein
MEIAVSECCKKKKNASTSSFDGWGDHALMKWIIGEGRLLT